MGKIVSFFGADSKCGVTQTVLSLSLALADRGYGVLLIHTEEPLGDDYTPGLGISMEEIKPFLKDGLWDRDSILRSAAYRKNLSIIGGANRAASGSLFGPEKTAAFLSDLSDCFEYILCDCGSDLSHGLCLGALLAASFRVTVLGQGEKALKRYEWLRILLSRLEADGDLFAVCRYREDSPCDMGYISSRLSLEKDRLVPVSFSPCGDRAEFYKMPLISFKNKKYEENISRLADQII